MASMLKRVVKCTLNTVVEKVKKETDRFLPPDLTTNWTPEKVVRCGQEVVEGAVLENVKKVMGHYLPGYEDWNEEEFEERIKESMYKLPKIVTGGILGLSLFLKHKRLFEAAHNIKPRKVAIEVTKGLNALRMPLAHMVDSQPRIKREGPITTRPSSFLDEEYKGRYFESFENRLDQKYDVIVIGSGPGGSQAAVAMLRQRPDLKVLVVEEGRDFTPEDLGKMTPSEIFTHLYTSGGVQFAKGKGGDPFPIMTGKVVGGTAKVNSGTFERVQDELILERLIEDHFGSERRYERSLLGVEGDYCVSQAPFHLLNSTQQNFLPLARAKGYKDARTLYSARKGCTGRAACYQGCLIGAKKSPDNVGLVEILDRELYENTFILGDTKAIKIETRRGKATAVAIKNKGRKCKVELEKGGVVVVAGGTIGSPKLLLNSGIYAGKRFLCHTQFEMSRLSPWPVDAFKGLPQGIMVPLRCGGTTECAHPSPGVLALLAPNLHGEPLMEYVKDYPYIEVLGAIVKDNPAFGYIKKGLFGFNIRYQHSPRDQLLIRETCCETLEIWASQQGDYYFHSNGFPYFSSGDSRYAEMEKRGWVHRKYFLQYKDYLMDLDNYFPTSSVHLFATTYDSIADHRTGRMRGYRNVFVTCASAMRQTGVNPQGTIFAVADIKGRNIIEWM